MDRNEGERDDTLPPRGQGFQEGGEEGPSLLSEDVHHVRADLRLIERAFRNQWQMPDAFYAAIPQVVMEILVRKKDPDNPRSPFRYDVRSRVRAAEVLAKLHNLNVSQAKVQLDTILRSEELRQQQDRDETAFTWLDMVKRIEEGGETQVIDDAFIESLPLPGSNGEGNGQAPG